MNEYQCFFDKHSFWEGEAPAAPFNEKIVSMMGGWLLLGVARFVGPRAQRELRPPGDLGLGFRGEALTA